MADALVLINGLPGSGKTTLARRLAAAIGIVALSKDDVKERLAELVPDLPSRTLGILAMDTVWSMCAALPGTVMVDSFWLRGRDLEFARAGVATSGARQVVEVWCEVPPAMARERYARRVRPAVHTDSRHLVEDWAGWVDRAEPLGLGPVVAASTDRPVDIDALAARVIAELSRRG